ncbi:MAG: insulinase family protein [Bacteroides sp.]|nr:insulinase family protein [Bacteroides sp.]MCM1412835.1 insulinase family protein [Bacteroides sp.]MCM1471504.1 insulinase family protein [Bacteroides sp.]
MTTSDQNFRKTRPTINPIMPMTMPPLVDTCYDGLRIHTLHKTDAPILAISALIEGGMAEANSIAQVVLCQMLKRDGSAGFSGKEIAATLDFNGATLKTEFFNHHTKYTLYTLESRLPQVIEPFADLVCLPTFPDHEFNVRREALANGIEVSLENVDYLASAASDRLIMGHNHPLAKTDTPQQIRAIDRDTVARFHSLHCSVETTDLFLCGNIIDHTADMIGRAFASRLKPKAEASLCSVPLRPEAPTSQPVCINKEGASQSAVSLTIPVVDRHHPDYLALYTAVYALGGYFGSRLMLNIREDKALTYGISASTMGLPEGGYVQIYANTDNRFVDRLINEVRREMNQLASNPPTGDELQRMRQSSLSEQATTLDSPFNIVKYAIDALSAKYPDDYFARKQAVVQSITPDIISEMATRYLDPDNMRIAIAGQTDSSLKK